MESDKHIPLSDLVKRLEEDVEGINSGEATKEEVHDMLVLARELHERLTVLRFKAFEVSNGDPPVAEEAPVEPQAEELTKEIKENVKEDVEADEIIPENQIDLMDAIEDVRVSLAEKHQRKPLSSVGEGLTILERANFTSILFSNDDSSFNDMLDAVDKCNTPDEALGVFRGAIKPSGRKEDIELAQSTFEERIPRIFNGIR